MTGGLSDRELLRRLVAIDTTSVRSNLPLVDLIADYCDRPGVRIDRVASAEGDKANLIVSAGPESDDDAGLMLSGHTDVVPPGDGWHSDPFVLTEVGDRLIARGACDMKGFLALAVNRFVATAGRTLAAPLVLIFTYDEEIGTLGARRLVERWPSARRLPRRAIIGEPTSLRPIRMHKGHLRLRLVVYGRSAHSGYPHLGMNAIEAAGRAIMALGELRLRLEAERSPYSVHFPEVPYAPLNLGRIDGGVAVNVVPERAVLDLGIRLLPGMAREPFVERVSAAVAGALDPTTFELTVISESPPMASEAEDHYEALRVAGDSETATGVSFATDAGWLQRLDCACVIWGPGSITVAHRPDEYLPAAELERAGAIVDRMIHRFCEREPIA